MIGQSSPPKKPAETERWRVPAVCLLLAAITFAVFGQTAGFGFVNCDDNTYVYENAAVAGGLSLKGLAWVFTHADCDLYHPLTMLSLMTDYQLHGLHAGGYHFTNVLLHTASVILLFLVLQQMTGALWRSAFVAAVFAIHPLRAESVAWVAERKDVLSGFFFMLTIGAYVRYVRKPGSLARYLTVAAAFVLALLSKPTVVTLPFVLLLLDYWPLQRTESARRLILEKIPLLALAAAGCAMTVLAAGQGIAAENNISMAARLGNALVSYAVYLRQMVWPAGLALPYLPPRHGLPLWEIALAGILLAGLSAVAWRERRRRPWLLTGWLWYLGILMPMIGIVQVGAFAHADRYTYLSQIGIYLALTWLVAEWRVSRGILGGLMAGLLGVLMVCAWRQSACWKSSESLWRHTLACTTGNFLAHGNLADVFLQKGKVDDAIAQYQEDLRYKPDQVEVRLNLGSALLRKGKADDAIIQFQAALQIKPGAVEAHLNLGNAFLQNGKVDEAIAHYQKTLQLRPDYTAAHYNLGNALLRKGKVDEAIAHYQTALQLEPGFAAGHYNLGDALLQKGSVGQAIAQYQTALQIDPASPRIQNKLAWLLATSSQAQLRNGEKAVQLARQANELTGGKEPAILGTLAAALAEAGQFAEARENAQKAIAFARSAGQQHLAEKLNAELQGYKAGLPWRQ